MSTGFHVIVTFFILHAEADGQDPNFDVPVVTISAKSKTTAILPCTISSVGEHKVIWMDYRGKVLTLSDTRIIQDQRVSVERPYMRDWNLHIRNVRKNDSGEYQCQINTEPVKSKKIVLIVNEPPVILEDAGDKLVKEGDTVELCCKAIGTPPPEVQWYRRYDYDSTVDKEVIGQTGDCLKIHNISRYCEDVYECVAYNGIIPAASRKMKVTVQFPPEIRLLNNRISQVKKKETILDCKITANPHGYIVWRKGDKEITNTGKYGISIYEDDRYTKTLSLRIGHLSDGDFGRYTCFAQNAFGNDEQQMTLYEYIDRKKPNVTTTTTILFERIPDEKTVTNKPKNRHFQNGKTTSWKNGRTEPSQGNAIAARGGTSASLVYTYNVVFTLIMPVLSYKLCE